tara:strand:- start:910 stop:1989 length:1080 start_codon:yes stop_codon:yes gene_type:complete
MKVIVFLTEPASYTIDLVKMVYLPNSINYKFLYTSSYSKPKTSEQFDDNLFLDKLSIISRFKTLKKDYDENDVVLFSGYTSISFLLLWVIHIFSKFKKPISIISDTPLKIPSNLFKRFVKKWYLNYLFKNSYLNGLAGGNESQKDLFKYYGMSCDRIHFLPMVVDVNQFKFSPMRKRNEVFTFLFVGRFIPLKQIEVIIEEFLMKFEKDTSVQLILVGDGPRYNSIYENYSNYINILFKGRLTAMNLKREFELAHVFVLASNNENWGLVMNEAMSASLAVLSNVGIGANYDLIQDKDTGLIFDSSNKGDLANKMQILYRNKELYRVLTKNAYYMMHEYWNFNLYSKQLYIAMSKMLNHK